MSSECAFAAHASLSSRHGLFVARVGLGRAPSFPLVKVGSQRRLCACVAPDLVPLRGRTMPITTPLYYASAPPHVGSAYPTMAADTLARFLSLAGANPVFVTGCDEHGEKIAGAAAAAADVDNGTLDRARIQLFCDEVSDKYKSLWAKLGIEYDRFVRTTDVNHAVVVKEFMERVIENGDIYKDDYVGLYCTACEEYKDPKDLIDEKVCPIHLTPCFERNEENYFFALSKYQARLEDFYNENPEFVLPAERRNEVLSWIADGLRDFSVSRANNPWGIPMPCDKTHTIYVWFDALLGYISSLLEEGDPVSLDAAMARGWPADTHIIGKDILRFHAIYWPAMLMSAGVPLPKRVVGHGFLTKDGLKMGKSVGNTLDPVELVSCFGRDAVRYYFMRGVDFGRDGDFSEERFVNLVNADLANSFGNAVSRCLNLVVKNCDGELKISSSSIGTEDAGSNDSERTLRSVARTAMAEAYVRYQGLDFVGACENIMSLCTAANAYIDDVAPWTGLKSDDPVVVDEAYRSLVAVLEITRIVAVGLSPVVPDLSQRVYAALGLENEMESLDWERDVAWGRLTSGMRMVKPAPLFPRLSVTSSQESVESKGGRKLKVPDLSK